MFKGISKHIFLVRELLPFTFVLLLWLIHLTQEFLQVSFIPYGLLPRTTSGLLGILTTPLIHGDFGHLASNSLPMIVLGYLFFMFYRSIAHKVFLIMYLLTGVLMWAFATGGVYHVGASGIIYGLAAFLFLSGVLRKHRPLMVVSLFVVFMYGSMVWYVLPVDPHISWEGHLFGALTGFMLAIVYRKEGPQRRKFDWEEETEDPEDTEWLRKQQEVLNPPPTVVYHFKPAEPAEPPPPPKEGE